MVCVRVVMRVRVHVVWVLLLLLLGSLLMVVVLLLHRIELPSLGHLLGGHPLHLRVRLVQDALHRVLAQPHEAVRDASEGDGQRLRHVGHAVHHGGRRPRHHHLRHGGQGGAHAHAHPLHAHVLHPPWRSHLLGGGGGSGGGALGLVAVGARERGREAVARVEALQHGQRHVFHRARRVGLVEVLPQRLRQRVLHLRQPRRGSQRGLDLATDGPPIVGGHATDRIDGVHPCGRGAPLGQRWRNLRLEGGVHHPARVSRFDFGLLGHGFGQHKAGREPTHEHVYGRLLRGACGVAFVEAFADGRCKLRRHIGAISGLCCLDRLLYPRPNWTTVVCVQTAYAIHNRHPGRHVDKCLV
mmetsp:Transcript_14055/g.30057  ORF Transcript_14055/g.30057 Transcript_14055/m.30057 type:complete len:355 (+) Transcript_14055:160-1224(+)